MLKFQVQLVFDYYLFDPKVFSVFNLSCFGIINPVLLLVWLKVIDNLVQKAKTGHLHINLIQYFGTFRYLLDSGVHVNCMLLDAYVRLFQCNGA